MDFEEMTQHFHTLMYNVSHQRYVEFALQLKDLNPSDFHPNDLKIVSEQIMRLKDLTLLDMWLNALKNYPESVNEAFLKAVTHGFEESVDMFLNYGVDIEYQNQKGMTPLLKAVAYDRVEIAKTLINLGADIFKKPEGVFATMVQGKVDKWRKYVESANTKDEYEVER